MFFRRQKPNAHAIEQPTDDQLIDRIARLRELERVGSNCHIQWAIGAIASRIERRNHNADKYGAGRYGF